MDIQDMSPQEKSVELFELVGCRYSWAGIENNRLMVSIESLSGFSVYQDGNLYDPKNMALAWEVLNWALRVHMGSEDFGDLLVLRKKLRESLHNLWGTKFAQAAWLDKILELAIEADLLR